MSASQTPSVPTIEYAEFDAMKEVASTLKAAYLRRAVEAANDIQRKWWIGQSWIVDDLVAAVNNEDANEIRATAEFFAGQLGALESSTEAA